MRKIKKIRFLRIALFILFAIFLTYGITTSAKYVTDRITSYYLRSKNFYFSSNLLDKTNPTYQIGTWSGVGEFDISFDLYSKENDYLFSESDITYEVSYTKSADVNATINKATGTLYSQDTEHSDKIIITVIPQRVFVENESVTVSVLAKSTSPYKKEIRATFVYIVGQEGVSYSIQDEANSNYMFLKVTNDIDYCTVITAFGDYSVNDHISDSDYRDLTSTQQLNCVSQYITLQYNPSDILIDSTSAVLEHATYTTTTINSISHLNSITFAIAPNSTVSIKYYKINPTANNTYPTSGGNSSIITVTASNPI